MARDFRRPERRQGFLLPPDTQDWLPQDDIVHLVLDAVSLMDLSKYEEEHRVNLQAGNSQGNRIWSFLDAYVFGCPAGCCWILHLGMSV